MSEQKLPKLDSKVEEFAKEIRATMSFDAEKKKIALADDTAEKAIAAYGNELVTKDSIEAVHGYNNFFKASAMLAVGRECTERAKENKDLDVVTAAGRLAKKSTLEMTWARKTETPNSLHGGEPTVTYGGVKGTLKHQSEKIDAVSAVSKILKAEGAASLAD